MQRLSSKVILFSGAIIFAACTAEAVEHRPSGAATAASADAAPQGHSCFWDSQVSGFSAATNGRILVHTGANEVYLFETLGSCPDIDFAQAIGFDVSPPGMVCSGLDVTLIVPSTIGQQKCAVRMIQKMSEAEAKNVAR